MTATILHGDCRQLMAGMYEASIDAIVCDPPYGLSDEPDITKVLTAWLAGEDYEHPSRGFMGKEWDSFVPGPLTWAEAYRVLKPGGHLFAFFGTRTYDIGTIALRLAGFEVRDMIDWLYGSGFPKAGNLKPGHEPIVVARKPFKGSRAACIAAFGTGGLDIEACRVGETGARNNGRKVDSDIYGKFGPTERVDYGKGRYPSNVVHDGSDEVVSAFPIAPGQLADAKTSGERKTSNVYGVMRYSEASADSENNGAVGFKMKPGARRLDSGTAARFFYCAKASKSDRDEGLGHLAEQKIVTFQTGNGASGSASSISEGRETQYRNTHPTVKPEGLMRWLCRLANPGGGVILDPFAGSGSTGKAAVLEGFDFIGCEMDAGYVENARARIAAAEARRTSELAAADAAHPDLFADHGTTITIEGARAA